MQKFGKILSNLSYGQVSNNPTTLIVHNPLLTSPGISWQEMNSRISGLTTKRRWRTRRAVKRRRRRKKYYGKARSTRAYVRSNMYVKIDGAKILDLYDLSLCIWVKRRRVVYMCINIRAHEVGRCALIEPTTILHLVLQYSQKNKFDLLCADLLFAWALVL